MDDIVKFNAVESKMITIRGQQVILDRDVAELYGVETKRVNEAVKNNPNKFSDGYVIYLSEKEHAKLVENFDQFNVLKRSTVMPKAFTEKGLYMLATILKSVKATQTTIAIVETYAKICESSRTVAELSDSPEKFKQKSLMQKSGDIIADLLGEDMKISDTKTSIELNFAVLNQPYNKEETRQASRVKRFLCLN